MEVVLRTVLPRLLGDISFEVYAHQCKHELLARLPARLSGYRRWIPDDWRIVVVVDRDSDDCLHVKRRLERISGDAGFLTRSSAGGATYSVVNRLAVEELEAWYFGDWQAVKAAYPRVSPAIPGKAGYRDPDAIRGGTWEQFERILRRAGYFTGGLRKIEAARAIAPHLTPGRTASRSFQVFCDAMREMADA